MILLASISFRLERDNKIVKSTSTFKRRKWIEKLVNDIAYIHNFLAGET